MKIVTESCIKVKTWETWRLSVYIGYDNQIYLQMLFIYFEDTVCDEWNVGSLLHHYIIYSSRIVVDVLVTFDIE
jgi:hypothetical protein